MKRKTIVILAVVFGVLVLAAAAIAVAFNGVQANLATLADTPVTDVDLSAVPDGTYRGEYAAFPVSAVVDVTVEDHAIRAVTLVAHRNGQGQAAEAILGDVETARSLAVDAVSGATYSSKVILLAIRDGLIGAGGQE